MQTYLAFYKVLTRKNSLNVYKSFLKALTSFKPNLELLSSYSHPNTRNKNSAFLTLMMDEELAKSQEIS